MAYWDFLHSSSESSTPGSLFPQEFILLRSLNDVTEDAMDSWDFCLKCAPRFSLKRLISCEEREVITRLSIPFSFALEELLSS